MVTKCSTRTLNRFSKPSTVALWNSKIRATVNEGCSHEALLLFHQMKQLELEPNNLTFPFIAKACAKLFDLRCSQIIHTHVVKSPFWSDIYVQTAMVDMYVKCDRLDFAHKLFEKMPERDVACWNVMIMGFAHSGVLDRVLILFREMRLASFKPDSITVIGLTQSSFNAKNLKMLKAVHCFGIQNGIEADASVANTWISAYAKFDEMNAAEMVFDGIPVCVRTVVSWNSMIGGYAHVGRVVGTIIFYKQMCQNGVRPDVSTILSLLSSFVHLEVLLQGKMIHSHAIQTGCDLDTSVINNLISMYSKCGDIDSARDLFNRLYDKTCVSWTAMISGYAEKGNVDEALALFHAMEADGEKPDSVTIVSLLSACGEMGALELGRWINRYAISNRLVKNIIVCNALIDMYAKCGNINDARELFYALPERTIISWTTMIAGSALNGEFREALDLFSQMVELGWKPNHITFLAVLQACTHAGFLEKGLECFDLMTKVYKIIPRLEHYACMADLFGRKGKLKEALEFIKGMPIKPDAGVWGALLGACKIHGDVEIAEYVAKRIFELAPKAAVPYVAMANIYAAEERWEDVAKIRTMMKLNKVKKSPGHSLVQVNEKIHAFTVEDRFHPEGLLIYEVLYGLALQLKDVGLRSNLECIMGNELE